MMINDLTWCGRTDGRTDGHTVSQSAMQYRLMAGAPNLMRDGHLFDLMSTVFDSCMYTVFHKKGPLCVFS